MDVVTIDFETYYDTDYSLPLAYFGASMGLYWGIQQEVKK